MRKSLLVMLVGCGSFVEPAPAAPTVVFLEPPPTIIENNITFVTTTSPVDDDRRTDETPPSSVDDPPSPPPRAAVAATTVAPMCACLATASLPVERPRRLASTTVASCDAYLEAADRSARCATLAAGPLGRITESLDLARRTWRDLATSSTAGRASLVDSCAVAQRQIASALVEACPGVAEPN